VRLRGWELRDLSVPRSLGAASSHRTVSLKNNLNDNMSKGKKTESLKHWCSEAMSGSVSVSKSDAILTSGVGLVVELGWTNRCACARV
jgi:hypothetical protein